MKIGPYELDCIVTGDARLLAQALPDESIDFIFTDPVYERVEDYAWLAETAARVLKPNSACLAWIGTFALPDVLDAMRPHLAFRWQLIEYRSNEIKHSPNPTGKCVYACCLWFDKGKMRPKFAFDLRAVSVFGQSSNYKWSKPPVTIEYWTERFTNHDAVVFDPFTGGGTVPAVCKMLGRHYLAFEIDPATAERARERVHDTQPPLPLVLPEQAGMFRAGW